VNGANLNAQQIYQLISEGGYFDNNEEAQCYLQSLAELPLIGPVFWHQFHDFTVQGFTLVSALFDVIAHVEKTAPHQALHSGTEPTKPRCIYCLTTTGNFTSEEHIIPESLGNDELVLPTRYVCDRCNNGVLAILDNMLLKFEPVAFLQVQ